MRSLKIMAAHANLSVLFASAGITNAAGLLSPDPREVAVFASGGLSYIRYDLGAPKVIDTFFMGHNTFGQGDFADITISNDPTFTTFIAAYRGFVGDNSLSVTPVSANPRKNHGVVQTGPVIGRYVEIAITTVGGGSLGVFACGDSFVARWGQEMGAGRPLLDRSTVEALPLGGFGIDPGAITGGYQWTFGDLQQSEITALYRLIASVGQSRSVLVIEDPDFLYDAPTIFGSTALSGGSKIVTKTGGANGYNAGVNMPFRQGVSTGLSLKYSNAAGVYAGFFPAANVGGVEQYALEIASTAINRHAAGVSVALGFAPAANDRFATIYDEGRQQFRALRNGVVIDAIPAPIGLATFPSVGLFNVATPDKAEELNVYDLGAEDRIHWGLLQKLDTFERADPANWRWSLAIGDWA